MDEDEFWSHLEFRVCREMEGLEEPRKLRLWCDGFYPENFVLDAIPAYVEGRAWINGGSDNRWRFRFVLNSSPRSRQDISWSALLPAEESTGWLLVDVEHKRVLMDIRAAVPLGDEE